MGRARAPAGAWLVVAACAWGVAIAGFGLAGDRLWLGVSMLVAAGGADIVTAILRATIIQREVPAAVRGRVWGVNFLVLNGGPRLGDFTGGMIASIWTASFSVIAGGLAALVGTALYTLTVPEVARYTSSEAIDDAADDVTPTAVG